MARRLQPEYVIRDLLALSTSIHLFEIFLNVLKIIHYSLLFINAAAVDRAVQIGQKSGFLVVYKLLRKIRWQHISLPLSEYTAISGGKDSDSFTK